MSNHGDSTVVDDYRCIGEIWRFNVDDSRLTDSDVTDLGYCNYLCMMMKIGGFSGWDIMDVGYIFGI